MVLPLSASYRIFELVFLCGSFVEIFSIDIFYEGYFDIGFGSGHVDGCTLAYLHHHFLLFYVN